MKVMQIADIHLQGGFESDEAKALLDAAVVAIENQVKLVVVAGDIFEAKSTPEQRLVFKSFLRSFTDRHIKVVIIRGNHDEAGDLLIYNDPDQNIYVFEQPEALDLIAGDEHLRIHLLPHFNAGAIALQQNDLAAMGEVGTDCFSTIMDTIFNDVHKHEGPSLVVGHGTVNGAAMDNGYVPKENGIHLNLSRLETLGCPVLLGHFHRAQNVSRHKGFWNFGGENERPMTNVWYCGSITRQTYGEAEGDKGVLIHEYDGAEWLEPVFVSLNPVRIVHLDAQFESGAFQVQLEDPETYHNARVRFRYTVKQADLALVNLAGIEQHFRYAAELKIEPIVDYSVAVRCEAITQAETVEDCFRAWAEAKGQDPALINAALDLLKELQKQETGAADAQVSALEAGQASPDQTPAPVLGLSFAPLEELADAV